jgi:hypothetical protein
MARFPVPSFLLVTFGMGIISYNARYGKEVFVAEILTAACLSPNPGSNSSVVF